MNSILPHRVRSLAAVAFLVMSAMVAPPARSDVHRSFDRTSKPCGRPDLWPLSIRSTKFPLLVHYSKPAHADVAKFVLRNLERFWRIEVRQLGFTPPLPDGGACGPDDAFDVWLWRGADTAYVESIADEPSTPWDDQRTTMVVDPWGEFGQDILDSTLSHELNHTMQAAQDWYDCVAVFEMTSAFIEWVVVQNQQVYRETAIDFQAHPELPLDYDDDYATWFMYGASLYLHFLRDRYYEGDVRFVAEMWRRMRNPPGAAVDPTKNEPDFEDALDSMLRELTPPVTFLDSVTEFARWRWYTGKRNDGRHFQGKAKLPPVALAAKVVVGTQAVVVNAAPMMLGSAYIRVSRAAGGSASASISLRADAGSGIQWVVQAVPGLAPSSDGETLDFSSGSASFRFAADGSRTLIVTALGTTDPDVRDVLPDRYYPVQVVIEPK